MGFRLIQAVKNSLIIILISMILLFLLNILAGITLNIYLKKKDPNYLVGIQSDIGKVKREYYPFEIYRSGFTSTNTININRYGFRDHSHFLNYTEQPINIGVFGGSTIWGFGVKDDETIPFYLDSLLGSSYKVHNFGELGFTSSQELYRLINLLHENINLDFIIMYDGVNDVFQQIQKDRVLLPNHVGSELLTQSFSKPKVVNWDLFFGKSLNNIFVKNIFHWVSLLGHKFNYEYPVSSKDSWHNCDEKVEKISSILINNWNYGNLIARSKGIYSVCVLQPLIYFYPEISLDHSDPLSQDSSLRNCYEMVYDRIYMLADSLGVDYQDMSAYPKLNNGDLFIDFHHLSSRGNFLIAEGLFELIRNK
jgi:hypothetical protein